MQMGLLPGSLCFPVFEGPQLCHSCSLLKHDLRWMEWVCLKNDLSVRNIRHLHAASHQRYIWPTISLSTVLPHCYHTTIQRKMQETSCENWEAICPRRNFPIIYQSFYLQNCKRFLGNLACIFILTYYSKWLFTAYLNLFLYFWRKVLPVISTHMLI